MSDKNEIVVLALDDAIKRILTHQLEFQMEQKGYKPSDFASLELGLNLPENWPLEDEVTMTQLVMLARKLGLQIRISEIEMLPMEIPAAESVKAGQD